MMGALGTGRRRLFHVALALVVHVSAERACTDCVYDDDRHFMCAEQPFGDRYMQGSGCAASHNSDLCHCFCCDDNFDDDNDDDNFDVGIGSCGTAVMMSVSGSVGDEFAGSVWRRAGADYSYMRGGSPQLNGNYLFYLNSMWRIGSDVTSTYVSAYGGENSGLDPVGTTGWHKWEAGQLAVMELNITCFILPPTPTPASPSPPSPPSPPAQKSSASAVLIVVICVGAIAIGAVRYIHVRRTNAQPATIVEFSPTDASTMDRTLDPMVAHA